MSIEGFLLHRKRYRTPHNMYQLISDEEHFDMDIAMMLLETVGKEAENSKELWTVVPPGYRWELVK